MLSLLLLSILILKLLPPLIYHRDFCSPHLLIGCASSRCSQEVLLFEALILILLLLVGMKGVK